MRIYEFLTNCERFFLRSTLLSFVKISFSLFPPYFRDLELDVLEDIFPHAVVEKEDKRLLKTPPKKNMKPKPSLPKTKTQEKALRRKAPKKRVSKKNKVVKRKTSKKKK